MTPTIEQIYSETIRLLSGSDRLRLARLILNDIPDEAVGDWNDDWSEEDLRDATRRCAVRCGDRQCLNPVMSS